MRILAVLLGLILSGCLVSARPLVVAENADWPLDGGVYLNEYTLTGEEYTRRIDSKTKRPETGHLSREDGWYVYRQANDESKPARFRLSRIDENRWLMMISPPSTGEQTAPWYGLVTRHGDFYLNAHFTRANFHAFRQEMERTRPAEWAEFRRSWRDGRSAVTFSSLDVLKTLLPRMADGGFALKAPVAYRVEADPARVEAFERRRQLRQQMAELDRQRRELCGGRVCAMRDKEQIYRTDTLKPHKWYDNTGRLLPQSEWPK